MSFPLVFKPFAPTRALLKRLAGNTYFQRGEDYYEQGNVLDTSQYQNQLTAKVRGSRGAAYRVKLKWHDSKLQASCSCPLGEDGEFCKHCVAVGLTWLKNSTQHNTSTSSQPKPSGKTPRITMEDVEQFLASQDTSQLVQWLMEQTLEDDRLRDRLMLQVAKSSPGKALDIDDLRQRLTGVFHSDALLDSDGYFEDDGSADELMETLDNILAAGYWEETIELTEHGLSLIEDTLNTYDEGPDDLMEYTERLELLHLQACQAGTPDPIALASRLYGWQVNSEWDIFHNALTTYAEVLGEDGGKHYKQLARSEWEALLILLPEQQTKEQFGKRFRLSNLMLDIARQAGDIEAEALILQKDLSGPYQFSQLVTLYKTAEQWDKVAHWAKQGLEAFGERAYRFLLEAIIEACLKTDQPEQAVEWAWKAFLDSPCLTSYQRLKTSCHQPDAFDDPWPKLRMKALNALREHILAQHQGRAARSYHYFYCKPGQSNHTELVRILLWEGSIQSAWEEAQAGYCEPQLLLKLAEQREVQHPEQVIEIYQDHVKRSLEQKTKTSYGEAVQYLKKLKIAMKNAGEEKAFKTYLQKVKTQHKAKRNFMALLDKSKDL